MVERILLTLALWHARARRTVLQALCEHRQTYLVDYELGAAPFTTYHVKEYCAACDKIMRSEASTEPIIRTVPQIASLPEERLATGHEL